MVPSLQTLTKPTGSIMERGGGGGSDELLIVVTKSNQLAVSHTTAYLYMASSFSSRDAYTFTGKAGRSSEDSMKDKAPLPSLIRLLTKFCGWKLVLKKKLVNLNLTSKLDSTPSQYQRVLIMSAAIKFYQLKYNYCQH